MEQLKDSVKRLNDIKDMLSGCKGFVCSSNYYYELHQCPQTDEKVKVVMEYTLSGYPDEKIINFGICPHCSQIFYHEDFKRGRL